MKNSTRPTIHDFQRLDEILEDQTNDFLAPVGERVRPFPEMLQFEGTMRMLAKLDLKEFAPDREVGVFFPDNLLESLGTRSGANK
jgi:hypothetical protein